MDKILYEKIRYKIIARFHWMIFYRIKDTNSYKVNRASLDKYNSSVTFNLTKYDQFFFTPLNTCCIYIYIHIVYMLYIHIVYTLKYVKIIFPSFEYEYTYV